MPEINPQGFPQEGRSADSDGAGIRNKCTAGTNKRAIHLERMQRMWSLLFLQVDHHENVIPSRISRAPSLPRR